MRLLRSPGRLVSRAKLTTWAWRGSGRALIGVGLLLARRLVDGLPLVGQVLGVAGLLAGIGFLASGGWSLARFAVQMWRRV